MPITSTGSREVLSFLHPFASDSSAALIRRSALHHICRQPCVEIAQASRSGGKEFLCSRAAAGTRHAATPPPQPVKTCRLFHGSEAWNWLVIFFCLVLGFFCSICFAQHLPIYVGPTINLLCSREVQTCGKQQWSRTWYCAKG